MSDSRIAERVQRSADARAFLFWSRMPVAENSGDNIVLKDQRFLQIPARGSFTVILPPD
jgi:inner membrane protein